jgi:DNA-binding SARP family transcriptional activator/predicted ATPase
MDGHLREVPMPVTIDLLGGLRVRQGARDLTPSAIKQRVLLATLALERGVPVSQDVLIDELWEHPPRTARNVLQSYVSRLRTRLRDTPATIRGGPAGYHLEAPDGTIDTPRFLALIDDLSTDRDAAARRRSLEAAQAIWQGGPVPDLHLGPRGEAHRVELEQRHAELIEHLTELWIASGDAERAIPLLRELTGASPLRERAWERLVLALVTTERWSDAVTAYDQVRRLLIEELGISPGRRLQALHGQALQQRTTSPTSNATTTAVTTSATPLPRLPRPLIGRDEDIARLLEQLQDRHCVSVVGPPGVGTTSVMLATAATGVHTVLGLVDLSEAVDEQDVVRAVRDAACPFLRADATVPALVTALEDRVGTLFVDLGARNVAVACGPLTTLVRGAPRLRLLIATTHPLRLPGEQVHRLDPLPTPSDIDDLAAYRDNPAVRLLLVKAREVGADLDDRDPATLTDLGALARDLDGLPLALELAGAHLATIAPRRVRERLAVRVGLHAAETATNTDHPLQRTLACALDSLGPRDQRLLRRLCRAHRDLTAEDAHLLADGLFDRLHATEDALERLAEASLLQVSERSAERVAFHLLAPLRALLRDPPGTPEDIDAGQAHASWVLTRIAESETGLRSADHPHWSAELHRLAADIRSALTTCIAREDAATAVELLEALWWHWYLEGNLRLGLEQVERVLALPGSAEHPAAARVRVYGAAFATLLGAHAPAIRQARDAAADLEASGDLRGQGHASNVAAMALGARGDTERALELAQVAIDLHRRNGDTWCTASTAVLAASLHLAMGRPALAQPLLDEALATFHVFGDRHGIANATQLLADVALIRDDPATATFHLEQGLDAAVGAGQVVGIATATLRTANLLLTTGRRTDGRMERACLLLGAAQGLARRRGVDLDELLGGLPTRLEADLIQARGVAAVRRLLRSGAAHDPVALTRQALGDPDRVPASITALPASDPPPVEPPSTQPPVTHGQGNSRQVPDSGCTL